MLKAVLIAASVLTFSVMMPSVGFSAEKGAKGGGDKGSRGGDDHRGDRRHGGHGRGGGGLYLDLGGSRGGYECPRGMRWSYRRERCVWY